MKNFASRGRMFATLTVLGFGASTLLTGCCEKEECANPDGSVCNTAATVIEQAGTGLALQLANGTVLVPTGATWTNFRATIGEKVTIGYASKQGRCGGKSSNSTEIGCITAATAAPTGTR